MLTRDRLMQCQPVVTKQFVKFYWLHEYAFVTVDHQLIAILNEDIIDGSTAIDNADEYGVLCVPYLDVEVVIRAADEEFIKADHASDLLLEMCIKVSQFEPRGHVINLDGAVQLTGEQVVSFIINHERSKRTFPSLNFEFEFECFLVKNSEVPVTIFFVVRLFIKISDDNFFDVASFN